jgi:polysaccharide export outer membrane protein
MRSEKLMMKLKMRALGLLMAGVWLTCSVLASTQQIQPPAMNGPERAPASGTRPDAPQPAPAERNPRYKICRDDVLSLSFPLSPEFNEKVTVQPDGFISLESAGEVRVEGLTVPEAAETVKRAYANTLHDPIVEVDLTDFQKPFFTVLGQVGKPGQYDLRYDITVTQAIAVAGGFAETAKTQVLLYRAVSASWAEVRELKIKDILHGKDISEDVHLRPGDMIFVPEKAIANFKKYVPYGVGVSPSFPSVY